MMRKSVLSAFSFNLLFFMQRKHLRSDKYLVCSKHRFNKTVDIEISSLFCGNLVIVHRHNYNINPS